MSEQPEELLKIWGKHLTALKLKSPYGDALAEKYWNEFIRRGGKPKGDNFSEERTTEVQPVQN
jgi:hypothetical protein